MPLYPSEERKQQTPHDLMEHLRRQWLSKQTGKGMTSRFALCPHGLPLYRLLGAKRDRDAFVKKTQISPFVEQIIEV